MMNYSYRFDEIFNLNPQKFTKETLLFISNGEGLKDSSKWKKYTSLLPYSMKNELNKFHQWEDQKNYLVGRLLVYLAYYLATKKTLDFSCWIKNNYGKPFIRNSNLKFNISHSGNQVVCISTVENTIGIDIEEIIPLNFNEFTDHFTTLELKEVDLLGALHFYKLWTTKEAIIKCLGEGLGSIPLKEIKIIDSHTAILAEEMFYLNQSNYKNFVCSIASKKEINGYSLVEVLF